MKENKTSSTERGSPSPKKQLGGGGMRILPRKHHRRTQRCDSETGESQQATPSFDIPRESAMSLLLRRWSKV